MEEGSVRVLAITPLDVTYLRSLEGQLSEWSSAADQEAFQDL